MYMSTEWTMFSYVVSNDITKWHSVYHDYILQYIKCYMYINEEQNNLDLEIVMFVPNI